MEPLVKAIALPVPNTYTFTLSLTHIHLSKLIKSLPVHYKHKIPQILVLGEKGITFFHASFLGWFCFFS